jgi:hypothetical protein
LPGCNQWAVPVVGELHHVYTAVTTETFKIWCVVSSTSHILANNYTIIYRLWSQHMDSLIVPFWKRIWTHPAVLNIKQTSVTVASCTQLIPKTQSLIRTLKYAIWLVPVSVQHGHLTPLPSILLSHCWLPWHSGTVAGTKLCVSPT